MFFGHNAIILESIIIRSREKYFEIKEHISKYQWIKEITRAMWKYSELKDNKNIKEVPGWCGSVGWSVLHAPKWSQVQFQVRAHTWVMGLVLIQYSYKGQLVNSSLSYQCFFSLSLPLPLRVLAGVAQWIECRLANRSSVRGTQEATTH